MNYWFKVTASCCGRIPGCGSCAWLMEVEGETNSKLHDPKPSSIFSSILIQSNRSATTGYLGVNHIMSEVDSRGRLDQL